MLGELKECERAGRGDEALRRVLGIEARLHRPAVDREFVLRQRDRLARRDAQLPFDKVDAGDLLGHRMLDLQPRVHFHEPDAVGAQALRRVGDELDRPCTDIIDRLRGAHRGGAELGARGFRSEEHTSELQSLMRITYAVFCLKTKQRCYLHYLRDLMQSVKYA